MTKYLFAKLLTSILSGEWEGYALLEGFANKCQFKMHDIKWIEMAAKMSEICMNGYFLDILMNRLSEGISQLDL